MGGQEEADVPMVQGVPDLRAYEMSEEDLKDDPNQSHNKTSVQENLYQRPGTEVADQERGQGRDEEGQRSQCQESRQKSK